MNLQHLDTIDTPYTGISNKDYQLEKRRLQLELLRIQQHVIKNQLRIAIVLEGRDAAGKGSTIKRLTEYLMPAHATTIGLGIPSKKESKYWFNRYEKHFPSPAQMVFFDRSWYSRALIEPTMGYCTQKQYHYFMKKVIKWEHNHIDNGLLLVKFYLSIDKGTQLIRLENRLTNPLTVWKFSNNDLKAREKWKIFTHFKQHMFDHTSSQKSPWIVINGNKKRKARLTCMLHLVRLFNLNDFKPLTGEDILKKQHYKLKPSPLQHLSIE